MKQNTSKSGRVLIMKSTHIFNFSSSPGPLGSRGGGMLGAFVQDMSERWHLGDNLM